VVVTLGALWLAGGSSPAMTTPAGTCRTATSTRPLNLARMADRHAQAKGIPSYVARTGRFTLNARGGQVSLVAPDQLGPVKREDPSGSSQRGDAVALAGWL
jgi:hypothetical protein